MREDGGIGRPVRFGGAVLAALTAAGAGLTLLILSVLTGPNAIQGSARGTALVLLVLGVPALLVCRWRADRGSRRAAILALGVTGSVTYNCLLLLFSTPSNQLFLLYVAMMTWSLVTIAALVSAQPPAESRGHQRRHRPVAQ